MYWNFNYILLKLTINYISFDFLNKDFILFLHIFEYFFIK
jgi:hypothetical protein